MSRIGKKPILIPQDVKVDIQKEKVLVKGPKGELERNVRPEIKIEEKDNTIVFSIKTKTKESAALWGTTRSIVANMIIGVTEGFEKKLEIRGVGYKAVLEGKDIILSIGFSHTVKIKAPDNINFQVERSIVTISGIDKVLVGQIASSIKKVRKVEPYKGKGIRYLGEEVRRKVGKKAATAE